MSIVITVLDHPRRKVYMMADKRESASFGTYHDTFIKIRALTDSIFLGFTGYVAVVEKFEKNLRLSGLQKASEIIAFAEKHISTFPLTESTCTISGLFDDGKIFAVSICGDKIEKYINCSGEAQYFINSNDQIELYTSYFLSVANNNPNFLDAMAKTVVFASQQSKLISSDWISAEIKATNLN